MQTLETPEDDKPRPTYKSFKKKFLKLRYGFDKRMRESNHSFEDEGPSCKGQSAFEGAGMSEFALLLIYETKG